MEVDQNGAVSRRAFESLLRGKRQYEEVVEEVVETAKPAAVSCPAGPPGAPGLPGEDGGLLLSNFKCSCKLEHRVSITSKMSLLLL